MPLSRACALLEKESGGGRNVLGHDKDRRGPIPPFGGPVTRANYAEYLKRRRRDGRQQGWGPTQLTFFAFQDEADRHGGCWRPNINMYVRRVARATLFTAAARPAQRTKVLYRTLPRSRASISAPSSSA